MACNAGPDIIEDGLVLCLDAANINSYPKSGTTWSDLNKNFDATLENGPTFSSNNRGVLQFDGTNDSGRIVGPIGISGNDSRTVGIWVFPVSVGNNRGIFEMGQSGAGSGHFALEGYTGNFLTFNGWSADFNFTYEGNNKWQYICITHDGSTTKAYVNGEFRNSRSGTLNTSITSDGTNSGYGLSLSVCRGSSRSTSTIAMFHINNIAFTQRQILQNYQATLGRFT